MSSGEQKIDRQSKQINKQTERRCKLTNRRHLLSIKACSADDNSFSTGRQAISYSPGFRLVFELSKEEARKESNKELAGYKSVASKLTSD